MLVSVNPGLIIWTIVTFLVLVFVLGKWGWKPIIKALEGRESRIHNALSEADKAHAEARELREQYDDLVARAEVESREIIQRGRETADQLRREMENDTRAEAGRILEQARNDIRSAKEAALREIRDTVADLATEAAGKIVQENLDADRHRSMVDDLIERLADTKK